MSRRALISSLIIWIGILKTGDLTIFQSSKFHFGSQSSPSPLFLELDLELSLLELSCCYFDWFMRGFLLTNKRVVHAKCTLQLDNLMGSHQSTSKDFIVQACAHFDFNFDFKYLIREMLKSFSPGSRLLETK